MPVVNIRGHLPWVRKAFSSRISFVKRKIFSYRNDTRYRRMCRGRLYRLESGCDRGSEAETSRMSARHARVGGTRGLPRTGRRATGIGAADVRPGARCFLLGRLCVQCVGASCCVNLPAAPIFASATLLNAEGAERSAEGAEKVVLGPAVAAGSG